MATVSSLKINLIAQTAAFSRNMDAAKKKMAGFTTSAQSMAKVLRSGFNAIALYGGIATGAAVGGLTVLTKNSLKAIDATSKLSDQIGISTENLAGLQHAAQLSGVENISKSLTDFSKKIGEFKMGIGEAKTAFKALGITTDSISSLSTYDALLYVADGLVNISNAADRVNLAQKLFGESGTGLLSMFAKGSAGLIDMQRDAKALGITFTRDAGAKVESFNDSITRLKESFSGLGNSIAVDLAPKLENIITSIKDFMVANRDKIVVMIDRLVDGFGFLVDYAKGFVSTIQSKGWVEGLKALGLDIIKALKAAFEYIKPVAVDLGRMMAQGFKEGLKISTDVSTSTANKIGLGTVAAGSGVAIGGYAAGSAVVASGGLLAAAGGAGYLAYKDISILTEIAGLMKDWIWATQENNRIARQENE
jgi:hypothetical protein